MPAGATLIGRYLLCDEIAQGGMASMFLGRMVGAAGFGRTVAIKRLHPQYAKDPQFSAMFIDEARLAARIHHPNVVPTIDVAIWERELLLVMEYVRGESLARILAELFARGERVPVEIAAGIMTGVLAGLHAAHEARTERGEPLHLVHRDVSPQNVLVGADGVPRVVDFGIAKAAFRLHSTGDGQLRGKVSYMAPEQLDGGGATRRSDLYAAAAILWEMLAGIRMRSAGDWMAIVKEACTVDPPPLRSVASKVPPPVAAVVTRGLARDPEARFSSALEMAAALEAATRVATAREIGAFVETYAAPAIERRDAQVRAMERAAAESTDPNAALGVTAKREVEPIDRAASTASFEPARAGATPEPIQMPTAAPKRSRAPVLVGVAIATTLLAGASAFVVRSSLRSAPAVAPAVAPVLAPAATTAPVASSATALATSETAPSASAPPPPSASSVSGPPAASGTLRPRAAGHAPKRAASPIPRGCDPPWTIDPDGSKRMKVECL